MQTAILPIAPETLPGISPKRVLTFRPFIDFLKKRKENTSGHISRYFSFVIEQFEQNSALLTDINIANVKSYAQILQLIYNTLCPIVEDEETHFWALSLPLKPTVFYSTNGFFNLVSDISNCSIKTQVLKSPEQMAHSQLEFCYSLILEKCYGIPSYFTLEMVRAIEDEKTKLVRYFQLNLDNRFIEVHPEIPLPELNTAILQGSGDHRELIPALEKILPLEGFRFEGFGIINIKDITAQYATENIKNLIFNRASQEDDEDTYYYSSIIRSLKTLVGNNDIEFGLLPVLQVNEKLIFNDGKCHNSMLMRLAKQSGSGEMVYLSLIENYLKNPKLIFFREITPGDEPDKVYLRMLKESGVVSYAVLPIFFRNSLAGVLEVYSKKKLALDEPALSRLDPAIPLLSQLLKNSVDEFNNSIDHIIKEKFTSLQPAVLWKFNEAAWHYLKGKHLPGKAHEMEQISFDNLYPLYGAVDIRNSTIERNEALHKDLQAHFSILIDTLQTLRSQTGLGLVDEKIFLAEEWLEKITNTQIFYQELKLDDFLENDITPFLLHFKERNAALSDVVDAYFIATDEKTGKAFEYRRQLETSMGLVISSVNTYLDHFKEEIQKAYPCYFEKFRTDGVEYDIYIGQSIAPGKPFSEIYLKDLRLKQLSSMAAIAKNAHSLLSQLSSPVETTQLIFVHSNPIDIRFRMDEKRFDVEGAYNIRYHIVKKRIDKVHIKDSMERLTQPNKIALVYFNQKEADEYTGYIRFLQDQKILEDNLEELELEELQGVAGLKALRVGVHVDGR